MGRDISAKCPQCGQQVVVTSVIGMDFEGHCPKCNIPVFGSIVPRIERYKNHDIMVLPYADGFRFRIMKVGGGVDWNPEADCETEDDAIRKAKEYIDTTPPLDWI